MSLTQPPLNAIAFAVNSAHRNEIPATTPTPGAASFELGFPYQTMIKKVAGGISPSGKDFNGIFNHLSQHQVWLNAGGQYKFNGELANAIGGYAKGALIQSNDGLRLYVSTINGNTHDLNTDLTGWALIGTSELQALLDTLQTNINNEQSGRISSDNLLNNKIDYEITQRTNAVNLKYDKAGGTISGNVTINGTTKLGAYTTLNPNNGNYTFYNSAGDKGLNIRIDSGVAHFDTIGTDIIQTSSKLQLGSVSGGYAIEIGDSVLGTTVIKTDGDKFNFNKPISASNLFAKEGVDWQDVTSSRVLNTTYLNSTGSPLAIMISGTANAGSNSCVRINTIPNYFSDSTGLTFFIVPIGGTYSLEGAFSLAQWLELK